MSATPSNVPALQDFCAECPERSACGFADLDVWVKGKSLPPIVLTCYRAGQTVIIEGAPANGLCVVCKGIVMVTSLTEGGNEAALHLMGTGGILNVTDGFLGRPASSISATALTESAVLFVKPEILHDRVKGEPDLMVRVCRHVASQMLHLQERYGRLLSHSARHRIGHAILELVRASGQLSSGKMVLPIRLKRSLLAQIAGTTQETVSRAMMSLRKRRLIQHSDRQITIPDVDRLRSAVAKNTPARASRKNPGALIENNR
jgi:CRP-like cAMP-binding protein